MGAPLVDTLRYLSVTDNVDGTATLNTQSSPFSPQLNSDAFTVLYPTDTQEVYQFRNGGLAGTIIRTITLNYVDSSKAQLLNGSVT